MYTEKQLQEKIQKLREEYSHSIGVDRKIVEIRGKLLKTTLDNLQKRRPQQKLDY